MKINYMSKIQANEVYGQLLNDDFKQTKVLTDKYQLLRDRLIKRVNDYKIENGNEINTYKFDLFFGLCLYEETNKIWELRKNNKIASNEQFWIYINLEVIPDLIYDRWKDVSNPRIRFYQLSRRIYTNTLWWYINLSWQGNINLTKEILKDFSTDTIVQLFERAGGGYNVDLYRMIIKKHHQLLKNTSSHRVILFRSLMKMNTIYLRTIEPEFYEGGIEGYVDMIILSTLKGFNL